jgi:NADH-quinone oxidoreductase subunit E
LGTACHVRGSNFLLDQVERVLSIKPGETSEDRQFTLEAVNCLGVCALGPVMVIDGKYFGNMNVSKVERVINKFRDKEVVADEE